MKIIHYIPSIDRESGGVGSYIQLLSKSLGKLVELHVVTHHSDHELTLGNCQLHYVDRYMHYFTMKRQWLELLSQVKPDVVHINCCWQPESAILQRWARNRGFKTVYSPHGMLEPWIMKRHYWTRKVPALLLYQKNALKQSDVLHATADSERQNLINLGYNKNVAVIPNGIDLSQIELKDTWKKTKTLLFLSRIHVKKGIELLVNAVGELKDGMQDYQVLIVGEGDECYIDELKNLVKVKQIDNIVKFLGGVYGDEKWKLYRQADVFILPTYSENFGIVVAEALACGTPVITTKRTPWEDLNGRNCGWWVDSKQKDITNAMCQALCTNEETMEEMGRNGRRLIEERYSIESIALQMKKLYEWIVGEGGKPSFLYM